MVEARKIHAQRDAAAKVQDILSVQYIVHATVLVVHVNISSELVSLIVTMQLNTLCVTSVGVRGLLNLYH